MKFRKSEAIKMSSVRNVQDSVATELNTTSAVRDEETTGADNVRSMRKTETITYIALAAALIVGTQAQKGNKENEMTSAVRTAMQIRRVQWQE